jgi:Sensors of blue-light using FAD
MLHQLAYMSKTEGRWSRADLLELLRLSRVKNTALGITGILLFRDGTFLQLLEGGRDEVDALYDTIRADLRHKDVTTIWRIKSESRWFADWSMGFRDLEDDPVTVPGLTDLLRGPVDASALGYEVVQALWSELRQLGATTASSPTASS